jgi:biotin carboxylase
MKNYVVMLDPYTSSERICDALLERNLQPIAILSERLNVPKEAQKIRLVKEKFSQMHYFNKNNYQELIEKLKQLNIKYVLSGCELTNDIADQMANTLCHENANSLDTIKHRMDKFEMQEAIRKAKLNAVKQLKISTPFLSLEQKSYLDSLGFPLIAKPTRANGTFSVFFCENINQVENAASQTINKFYPRYGVTIQEIVVQEYLQGVEYFVDTVSLKGEHKVISVQRYHKILHKGRPVYRYMEVADHRTEEAQQCIDYVKQVLSAVGLKYGLAHTEVFLTKNGPYLVEVNPRVSGAFNLPNKMAKYIYGRDQADVLSESILAPKKFLPNDELHMNGRGRVVFVQNWQPKLMGKFAGDRLSMLPSYKEHVVIKSEGQPLIEAAELGDAVALVLLLHPLNEQIEKDTKIIVDMEKQGLLY